MKNAKTKLPPFDEWCQMTPEDAARTIAEHAGYDAETERKIAAALRYFRTPEDPGAKDSPQPPTHHTTP